MPNTMIAGKLSALPPGSSLVLDRPDEAIAVFNMGGKLYACSNACPHAGGPLCDGFVEGTSVTCPWHGWRFELDQPADAPPDGVNRYPVHVQGDDILVEVPE